jgi:hypothetical protein
MEKLSLDESVKLSRKSSTPAGDPADLPRFFDGLE